MYRPFVALQLVVFLHPRIYVGLPHEESLSARLLQVEVDVPSVGSPPLMSGNLSIHGALVDELRLTARTDYAQLHLIVLPVMPPRIARMNNKFRYRIIIKCKNNAAFRSMIALLLRRFQALPQFRDVTIAADINPETLI